jgi:hypothetical protein
MPDLPIPKVIILPLVFRSLSHKVLKSRPRDLAKASNPFASILIVFLADLR